MTPLEASALLKKLVGTLTFKLDDLTAATKVKEAVAVLEDLFVRFPNIKNMKKTNSRKVNEARKSHKRSLKSAFKSHKNRKRNFKTPKK